MSDPRLILQEYIERNKQLLRENKKLNDALDYVMTTELEQYSDPKSMLEDVKCVVNQTLEDES